MQANKITDRYKYPISDQELDRRYAVTQKALQDAGLDCVVTQNHSPIFDGGIRYYLDTQTGAYSTALMIPADGKMVVVNHGPELDGPIPGSARNVEKMYLEPYCLTFHFSDTMAAEVIAAEIKARGYRRVGLYGTQMISFTFGSYLKENLPDVEFVDFSPEMAAIAAVKSEEEWELIELAVRCHERLFDALPALIVPGKLECEVRADLEHLARYMGCDNIGNVAVGSAEPDHPCMFVPHFTGNRRIRKGDTVAVMIEVAGPGGMYGELARTFTLGKPSDKLLKLFDIAKGCQEAVAAAAKPGVTGGELSRVFNDFVDQYGIGHNTRNAGHSQGYDMMEAPAIADHETAAFQENMFLSIHPELTAMDNFAICCDNFRITKEGAVRLTRTPQKIFQLDV